MRNGKRWCCFATYLLMYHQLPACRHLQAGNVRYLVRLSACNAQAGAEATRLQSDARLINKRVTSFLSIFNY